MKTLLRVCICFLSVFLFTAGLRADDTLRHFQQSLRDQGFYYGPIDGAPGDETTQAIRRYQIRNGLPVTSQLDDATRKSIDRSAAATAGSRNTAIPGNGSADRSTPAPRAAATPPPLQPDEADTPAPRQPGGGNRPDLRVPPGTAQAANGPPPRNAVAPSAELSDLFANTPYEFAPPPVQANVLRRAQAILLHDGFYDGAANGTLNPVTTEALTNFQEVNHLRRTGRLDVATLGLLRLLPGRQMTPPRRDGGMRRNPNIIFQDRSMQ